MCGLLIPLERQFYSSQQGPRKSDGAYYPTIFAEAVSCWGELNELIDVSNWPLETWLVLQCRRRRGIYLSQVHIEYRKLIASLDLSSFVNGVDTPLKLGKS